LEAVGFCIVDVNKSILSFIIAYMVELVKVKSLRRVFPDLMIRLALPVVVSAHWQYSLLFSLAEGAWLG